MKCWSWGSDGTAMRNEAGHSGAIPIHQRLLHRCARKRGLLMIAHDRKANNHVWTRWLSGPSLKRQHLRQDKTCTAVIAKLRESSNDRFHASLTPKEEPFVRTWEGSLRLVLVRERRVPSSQMLLTRSFPVRTCSQVPEISSGRLYKYLTPA